MTKPRVNFCWQCGKKLYGNHHELIVVDGYEKIVHKICAKALKAGYELPAQGGDEVPDGPWARGLGRLKYNGDIQ